ncbi:carbonic anhydrase 14-like isoform X2 [Microcaecilia unicolor]|uniref:carbonic anhydrase n=1 Tax=Microcaecilia unicolor TaxID=1415580 RepID=A0A6P7WQE3_9AMPH|nr:carbonic anhydrase 14-like isoform X2 [Microcaecilia unicolor]XP_030043413.1 carbonic anhydrase 14-like isoform X2 [Microcaecilia unicolor]
MLLLLIFGILQMLHLVLAEGDGAQWTYTGPRGQNHWSDSYPVCSGKAQSPINIETSCVIYDASLQPLKSHGYREPEDSTFLLRNDGHTVKVYLPPSMGLRLPNNYTTTQLHLHWGNSDIKGGAEHQLHVVHYNSDDYGSAEEAKDQPEGLAVLGVLIEVGEGPNLSYDSILSYLENIKYPGQEVSIPSFNVRNLLPDQLDQYYRYRGSLTTPPCYESVLWTVFNQKVQIAESQLIKLQHAVYSTGANPVPVPLQNNFRNLQSLNNRLVYSSFPVGALCVYSAGEIVAIASGTTLGLLGLSLSIYFLLKRIRAQRKDNVVVFKSSPGAPEMSNLASDTQQP